MRSREEALRRLGFARAAGGEMRKNGTSVRIEGRWCTLTAETRGAAAASDRSPRAGELGAPGLWKRAAAGDSRGHGLIFELPASLIASCERAALDGAADDATEADDASPFADAIAWALATASGLAPEGWCGPERTEVESWIPRDGLTVCADAILRQGTLVREESRLAIRFPIVPRVPDDLPAARGRWLRALADDAHARWRMVRVGHAGAAGAGRLDAEVDLTGVPRALAEPLFRNALDAIRWVVAWAVRPADFLVDTTIRCESLEDGPQRAMPAERSA